MLNYTRGSLPFSGGYLNIISCFIRSDCDRFLIANCSVPPILRGYCKTLAFTARMASTDVAEPQSW